MTWAHRADQRLGLGGEGGSAGLGAGACAKFDFHRCSQIFLKLRSTNFFFKKIQIFLKVRFVEVNGQLRFPA